MKQIRHVFAALVFSFMATSCIVDKEMDLKKEIDPVVTVVPGMKIIFGDTETLETEEILNGLVNAGQAVSWIDLVDFDYNGNFSFSTGSKTLKNPPLVGSDILKEVKEKTTLDVPSPASVSMKSALSITGIPALTEGVEAIRNINTNPFALDLSLAFSADGISSLTVKKGFRVELPVFLTINSVHEDSHFAADGARALTIKEDLVLLPSEPCHVGIDVTTSMNGPFKKGETIELKGDILFSGQIVESPKEGAASDAPLSCLLTIQTGKATLSAAEVLVSGSIPCGNMDTYPAVFNYAKQYVGLSDLELALRAENRMSVPLDMDARLGGEDGLGKSLCDYPVGTHEGAEPVVIPSKGESSWLFSGIVRSEGYSSYIFPGLENIVRNSEAAHFGFNNIRVTPKEPAWLSVPSDGGEGLFSGTAQFFMPFMVGKGTDSIIDYKVGHLQVDTTMTLDKFTPILFEMDVENTTPLSFRFAAEIVDKEGNVVSQYTPLVEGTVKGGSIASPGVSVLTVGFSTREIVPFDGINLKFILDPDAGGGIPLNRSQGVTFRRLRIVMPEGLTFDPAWLKYIQDVVAVKRAVDDVIEIVDSIND